MEKINQLLENMQLQLNNQTIILAVSTGIDSMVLLDLVQQLNNVKVIVCHVNHHRRDQSNEEQQYITNYCKEKNLKCYIEELYFEDTKNFQETARNKRYQFFERILKLENAKYLLTAHHATDNLETILMRLIKSSSHKGYAGIEQLQQIKDYYIYRPLLKLTKHDIYNYQQSKNIKYYNDESNDHDDYLRNRIRHNIIPEMEKENPSLYKAIEIYQEHILETNKMLFQEINSFINNEVSTQNNIISFKIDTFLNLSDYLKEQVLFEILKKHNLSKTLIEELIDQIKTTKSTIINNISNDLTMIKEYGFIKFGKCCVSKDINLTIEKEGTYFVDDKTKIIVDKNICYFETENMKMCYNIKDLPVTIRTRLDGDKIIINGKLKNLSDYLTNNKVSHFVRQNLLVLTNNLNQVIYLIEKK